MSKNTKTEIINKNAPMGFTLFLAWIGALIYFINHTQGFWGVILAILKSIVWPVFVIYKIFELLHL